MPTSGRAMGCFVGSWHFPEHPWQTRHAFVRKITEYADLLEPGGAPKVSGGLRSARP